MDFKGLNNNYSTILQNFANDLYEKDEDKVITKQEITEYLFTIKDDIDFISLNLSTSQAEAEIDKLLNSDNSTTKKDEITPTTQTTSATELQEQINKYNEDIKNYTSQKETLLTRNEEIKEQLDKEQQKYASLEEELANKNDEYEKIIKKINQATKKLEEDEQYQQKQVAYEAMSKFDPEKDGSWDNFLQNYIKTNLPTSKYKGQLQGLITSSDFLSADLKTLGAKLSSQGQNIATLSDEYQQNAVTIEDCSAKAQEAMLNMQTIQMTTKAGMGFQMGGCCKDPSENWSYEDYLRYMEEWQWGGGQEDLPETAPNYDIDYEWSLAGDGAFATKGADGQMHVYQPDTTTMAGGAQRYAAAARTADDGGWDYVGYKSGYLLCGEGGKQQDCYDRNGCCTGTIEVRSTSSPLSLDINGDGVKTSDKVIDYDIDGDGVVDKINDSADAVLVFDKDGDGISGEDGSECFGDNTDLDGDGKADGYKDGFEALKALAKKEGLINGKDDNKLDEKDLKTLEDKYGLKIKTGGYNSKAESLADVGITEINLADTDETTMLDNFDGNDNQLMKQEGATFKINGETREYADIWHKKLDEEDIKAQQTKTSDIQNNQNTIQQNQEKQEESTLNLNFDISSADFLNDKIKVNQRKASNETEEAQKIIKKLTSYKLDKDIEEAFNKKMMELQEQAQKALDEAQKEDKENEKDKKNNPFK